MGHPWEQQPGESLESYRRFLVYRNLGPLRSLDGAFRQSKNRKMKGKEGHASSGLWRRESGLYKWKSRALEWDIHNLEANGQQMAHQFIGILMKAIQKAGEKLLGSGKASSPQTYRDVLETIKTVAPYMTPELLEKISRKPTVESVPAEDFESDEGSDGADL